MSIRHELSATVATGVGTGSAASAKITIAGVTGKRTYVWWISFYNKAASTQTVTVTGGSDGSTTQLVLGAGATSGAIPSRFLYLGGTPLAQSGQDVVLDASDDTVGTTIAVAYSQF